MSLAELPTPSPASPTTAAAASPQPPTAELPPTFPLLSPPSPAASTPSPPAPPPLAFPPSVSPAIHHTPPMPLVPQLPTSPPPAILISPIASAPAPLPQSVVTPPPHAAVVIAPASSRPPQQTRKPVHSRPHPTTPSKPKPLLQPPPKSAPPPLVAEGPPPPGTTPLPPSLPSTLPQPVDKPPFWLTSSLPPTQSPSVFANERPIYQAPGSPSPSAASRPLPLAVSNGSFQGSSSRTAHSSIGLVVSCISVGALFLLLVALVFIWCKARNKSSKRPMDNHKFHQFETKGKSTIVPPQSSQDVLPSQNHVVSMTVQPQPPPPILTASIAVNASANSNTAVDSSNGSFTYEQLVAATNGFSDANLLGQGGFGYVHKGVLPDGREVAVKQLRAGSQQGEREFQAELEIISRVHHKHLVSLLGYCISGSQRLLVYEFVSNKTLEFHLHEEGQPVIDWDMRFRIAIGAAKGLAYLHEDCNPTIIHRDIKAANILLDSKFEAKVSDFGLAKYFNTSSPISHISTRVVGTFGYMAPEYASTGHLTDRSDVYSYGVVLLELITGHPAIGVQESSSNKSLVEWARPLLSQALQNGDFRTLTDPKLNESYNESQMSCMVACAAACVRRSGWFRPPMSQVVHVLEGDTTVAYLDERIRPALNTTSISVESGIYNDQHEHITKPSKSLFSKSYGISGCSENTSEYGLTASSSSNNSR